MIEHKNKEWNRDPNTWDGKLYIQPKHKKYSFKNSFDKLFS